MQVDKECDRIIHKLFIGIERLPNREMFGDKVS